MPTGKVRSYVYEKGYGFITPDDGGPDMFFHVTALDDAGIDDEVPHQQISDQLCMSLGMVMRYSKHIDRALNARAGMVTMERAENTTVKTIYAAIENRKC